MKKWFFTLALAAGLTLGCQPDDADPGISADEILGEERFTAIAYGGFRNRDRSDAPTVEQVKEDMLLLHAMGIRVVRTYHARLHDHAANVLKAIRELKRQDPDFEMYVMLGCWIQCKAAFSDTPDHSEGDSINNSAEVERAIDLAQQYPQIVKVIAVGNESMVRWAASYYVQPDVVLKWVRYLKRIREQGGISSNIWLTSSDNYASWGGEPEYRSPELAQLVKAVDYLSVHSYPFHDTHYNPNFWYVPETEKQLSKKQQIDLAIERSVKRVESQLELVANYLDTLDLEREIHIGETGWASHDNNLYGASGSHAADLYKQYLYYHKIRAWSDSANMSCFYFEAFDEPWKDQSDPQGSENHFGVFNVKGEAKPVIYDKLEEGVFEGLGRNGNPVRRSTAAGFEELLDSALTPPYQSEIPETTIEYPEGNKASILQILPPAAKGQVQFPAYPVKLTAWDGTAKIFLNAEDQVKIYPKEGDWWGTAFELHGGHMDLSPFQEGKLQVEISGHSSSPITLGLISGDYGAGTQRKSEVTMNFKQGALAASPVGVFEFAISTLSEGVDLEDISALFYLQGKKGSPTDSLQLANLKILK